MEYSEIINYNRKNNSNIPWWPLFAYHYTNITNAVSILDLGCLYSRANAEDLGIMSNDNASRQVIDMTNSDAKQSVRFYFRPLTPTQYYNEGYKHPQLRYDGDSNANCPVPIFFVFDLAKLLALPGVTFSETSRSGGGASVYSGVEAFANLDFGQIYSAGPMSNANQTAYRHAEIAHPSPMKIDSCLQAILCRNEFEQSMFLAMLKAKDFKIYKKYQPFIKVCKTDMFQNNGLFVNNCIYHDNILSISFSNSAAKKNYSLKQKQKNGVSSLSPLQAKLELDWIRPSKNAYIRVFHASAVSSIDYDNPKTLSYLLPKVPQAKYLRIELFIDGDLMCYKEQFLDDENTLI